MQLEKFSNAIDNFVLTFAEKRRERQHRQTESAQRSHTLTFCLVLIYYFSLCDFVLKFVPVPVAIPFRYLPEFVLYAVAISIWVKQRRQRTFPLLWPLCFCAVTMTASALLNSVSVFAALTDFRLFFRFAAFAYIGWKTTVKSQYIVGFMKGFMGLTFIQLAVGVLELLGGEPVQRFFRPVFGLLQGDAAVAPSQVFGEQGWIFGTLSNYNDFGLFMVMSCVIALAVFTLTRARIYLGAAIACGVAIVLSFSRHSLMALAASTLCFYVLQSKANALKRLMQGLVIGALVVVAVIEVARIAYPALEDRLATLVDPTVMTTDSVANVRFFIMAVLPPRFLRSYPLFGQGPLPNMSVTGDERDVLLAPPLKAAPELPGYFALFLGDVVWVMILGLYGCLGIAAVCYVFWKIAKSANRIRSEDSSSEKRIMAQVWLSILVAYVVSGFYSQEIFSRDCIPVFWVLAGMTLSVASVLSPQHRANPKFA